MPSKPKNIKRSYVPDRKAFARDNSNTEFYNSWAWRKTRKAFLNINKLCVHCEAAGIVTAATVADHITPINLGGDKLKHSNLQALCDFHHNKKSGGERTRGMG